MIFKPKVNSIINATLKNGESVYLRYNYTYNIISGKFEKKFKVIFKYQCSISEVTPSLIHSWSYVNKNGKPYIEEEKKYEDFKKEYLVAKKNIKNWKFYKSILSDPESPEDNEILNSWNNQFFKTEFVDYINANVTDWEFNNGNLINPLRVLWTIYKLGYKSSLLNQEKKQNTQDDIETTEPKEKEHKKKHRKYRNVKKNSQ